MLNIEDENVAQAIHRGIGDELRCRRDLLGLSQTAFGKLLPSRIGMRTVLEYEAGTRQLTVLRLVELAEGLEIPAPRLLGQGLQRARQALTNIPIRVDLQPLLACDLPQVRPLHPWAEHRIKGSDNGVIEVLPAGVRELAAAVGCEPSAVALQLAMFLPERT